VLARGLLRRAELHLSQAWLALAGAEQLRLSPPQLDDLEATYLHAVRAHAALRPVVRAAASGALGDDAVH
jgi:hypothetical protein